MPARRTRAVSRLELKIELGELQPLRVVLNELLLESGVVRPPGDLVAERPVARRTSMQLRVVQCLEGGGEVVEVDGFAVGPGPPGLECGDAIACLRRVVVGSVELVDQVVVVHSVDGVAKGVVGGLMARDGGSGSPLDAFASVRGLVETVLGDGQLATGLPAPTQPGAVEAAGGVVSSSLRLGDLAGCVRKVITVGAGAFVDQPQSNLS